MSLSGHSRFIGRFLGRLAAADRQVRPSPDKGENAQAQTASSLRFAPGVHLGAIADNRIIVAKGQVVKWYRHRSARISNSRPPILNGTSRSPMSSTDNLAKMT